MNLPRNHAWHRHAFVGVCTILLCFLGWLSVKEAISDLYLDSAHTELDRATAHRPRPPRDIEERIARYLSESLSYSPDNPYALAEAGRFRMLTLRDIGDSLDRMTALRAAKQDFALGVKLQPTSPDAWANYAQSKLYLHEYDADMFDALRRADDLGQWDTDTQRSVLITSLAAWRELPADRRASALRTLERSLYRDSLGTLRILQSRRRMDLLCTSNIHSTRVDIGGACSAERTN